MSFVDVTDMSAIRYRHVLLKYRGGALLRYTDSGTFKAVHAGGIVYVNGLLHVAGRGNQVLVFNLDHIREVNPQQNFGYRYTLSESSNYQLPFTTSFLSYDWSSRRFISGTFSKEQNKPVYSYRAVMGYHRIWQVDTIRKVSAHRKMQGAGVENDRLVVSASYGRGNDSNLLWKRVGANPTPPRTATFPPGLEDVHFTTGKNIWLLTEFGTRERTESKPNNRIVFAIRKSRLE